MNEDVVILEAKDCSSFDLEKTDKYDDVFQYFLRNQSDFEVFTFNDQREVTEPIVTFDPKAGKWRAGRFIGEVSFQFEGQNYKIEIEPRFGEIQLFRMLNEIFNVRFSRSDHSYLGDTSNQIIIRKLISYLWISMLSKANRYGLPKISQKKFFKGNKVRGSIDVRKSILPLHTDKEIVSQYREKSLDLTVMQLFNQAYQILRDEFYLGNIRQNKNAKYTIDQIKGFKGEIYGVTETDFNKIRLQRIYQSFLPVIDLSWDIIKNNTEKKRKSGEETSIGYFLDMAEIWEMYLISLLKKKLSKSGWQLIPNKFQTYNSKVLNRALIPDMVFKKGNEVIVFDAKYKLMRATKEDIDRTDYFQIHTYIHYLEQKYKVLIGGLIYPFSIPLNSKMENDTRSHSLFSQGISETKYCVDGIDLSFLNGDENRDRIEQQFDEAEQDFVNRINKLLSNQSFKKIA